MIYFIDFIVISTPQWNSDTVVSHFQIIRRLQPLRMCSLFALLNDFCLNLNTSPISPQFLSGVTFPVHGVSCGHALRSHQSILTWSSLLYFWKLKTTLKKKKKVKLAMKHFTETQRRRNLRSKSALLSHFQLHRAYCLWAVCLDLQFKLMGCTAVFAIPPPCLQPHHQAWGIGVAGPAQGNPWITSNIPHYYLLKR